jgi:GAF domain-containing protein
MPSSARLCEVSASVIGVTGSGVMLMSGDIRRGSLCATDEVSHLIEDLQYALGEGPCVEAYVRDRAVLEPDLAHPATPRWLAFARPAVEAGARAVFAFPLRVGSVRLGALNLYRDQPGPLSDEQHADALVMADLAAQCVLDMQADAPPGAVSETLETGADFHYAVHNAAGMVSVQLGVSITEALVRLRAAAFGSDRPLDELAQDVIARRVRFE